MDSDAGRHRGNVMLQLREMNRRITQLENSRGLERSSVGAGGLRIHSGGGLRVHEGGDVNIEDGGNVVMSGGGAAVAVDGEGNPQVRMGALSSDGFGLEQLVGSVFVPLAALAGGAEVDVVPDEETLQDDAGETPGYEDLDTVGPSRTFTTYTGKWALLLVAHAGVSTETAARMSYAASGAQSISAADARSSLLTDPDSAMGIQGSVVYANVHTGTPGQVTVTAKYRVIPPAAGPPASGVASWANRALIVIPY